MGEAGLPRLSKSRFLTGLQCPRALYLACYFPSRKDPVQPDQQRIIDTGTEVGRRARVLFPGGHLVAEDHLHGDEAVRSTLGALGRYPAVFEAAFEADGVLVRVDVLEDLGDAYGIVEVKSSTKVKDEHIPDVAVQWHVLAAAGLPVERARVLRIDSGYVHPGGEPDMGRLMAFDDVTEDVEGYLPSVPGLLEGMRALLADRESEPPAGPGPRCSSPHRCPFWGHCHDGLPEHHVTELPRIGAKAAALMEAGYETIADIPEEWKLTATQARHRQAVIEGRLIADPQVLESLADLAEPLHFLDFETSMEAIPRIPGTRPYQQVPFQWSDHLHAAGGIMEHREYLADAALLDPRRDFLETLLDDLETDAGAIVVYSSFERARLHELAEAFPDLADRVEALFPRIFDLEKAISSGVNHPDFRGRTSIKAVLPALVGEDPYAALAVHNGNEAIAAYARLVSGDLPEEDASRLREDMLAYCGTDTVAMVRVYEALLAEGRHPG